MMFIGQNGRSLDRKNLVTLAFETEVSAEVINGWVSVLNYEEHFRSNTSPRRLFFATDIALNDVILNDELCADERYAKFMEMVENCGHLDKTMNNILKSDLIFFPVVVPPFYFVVVVNLKHPRFIVIDSEDREGKVVQLPTKYEESLHIMVGMLLEYSKHHLSEKFLELNTTYLKTRWQVRDNKYDQGVILMRNMETYMGEDDSKWISGLYKESTRQKNQLRQLRTKYLAKILTNFTNKKRYAVQLEVERFVRITGVNTDPQPN